MSETFSADAIEQALSGHFGRPLRFFEEVDSTNTEALRWAGEGAPEGAVVATDHQRKGRGRWGRSWSSDPGKLLQFSVVLRPSFPLERAGLITTALGVACAEGIEEASGLTTTIKWPNDVRVEGRKLCGILVETHVVGRRLEAAVAGVGVNVGWSEDEIPAELAETATSIHAAGGDAPSRAILLASILRALERRTPALHNGAGDLIAAASRRSDVLGHEVRVRLSTGAETVGLARRLTETGELDLAVPGGARVIGVGEVEQLRPQQGPR
jgi:BirA family biotin operon repressor/biotin-[acetyl-CoA-carboxylase] ligase